jgi:hypothetical protein
VSSISLLWFVAVASLAAALIAWRKARANARRLEQVLQMYWELKYQHGELRVQVQRLTSPDAPSGSITRDAGPAAEGGSARPTDGFIPLSSLRR